MERQARVAADVPDVLARVRTESTGDPGATERLRRQLRHDIHHQLGTIMMLASVIGTGTDVGVVSRARSEQIVDEARWLEHLLAAYDLAHVDEPPAPAEPVRIDRMAADMAGAMALTGSTTVTVHAEEAWAAVGELALWRALRNLMGNALRAAGDAGRVAVRVYVDDGRAVAQVDDDGPGFGAGPPGLASLGLGIVQDFAAEYGGVLEIGASALGGGRARILLPAVMPEDFALVPDQVRE
jgi:signal transduction histidine kinase